MKKTIELSESSWFIFEGWSFLLLSTAMVSSPCLKSLINLHLTLSASFFLLLRHTVECAEILFQFPEEKRTRHMTITQTFFPKTGCMVKNNRRKCHHAEKRKQAETKTEGILSDSVINIKELVWWWSPSSFSYTATVQPTPWTYHIYWLTTPTRAMRWSTMRVVSVS